jgi:glycosyltransferase involved in cell wall biosynthesis
MKPSKIRVHICYDFIAGPWGGSNQFAKAFREYLISEDHYAEDPENADAILFVSHANIKEVIRLKRKFPKKLFIHRLDGPIILHNPSSNRRDNIAYWANKTFADATVFQSNWSRECNYILGLQKQPFETTILNASSSLIFNSLDKLPYSEGRKTKVIMSSWSSFKSKGFGTYQWLDDHLDFSKFELTFVGNSPILFKNIKIVAPLPPAQLATLLKQHDIYITASEKDPCSNALIEAMSCGLPAIALNDGGHPEIVGVGGKLFNAAQEIPKCLDEVCQNYNGFKNAIAIPNLNHMGQQYMVFTQSIINTGYCSVKRIGLGDLLRFVVLRFF